jgi:hypothetical protein
LRTGVIQRIGQAPFGYTVASFDEKVSNTEQQKENARLNNLAAILANNIETLRMRAGIWKSAKEKILVSTLTSARTDKGTIIKQHALNIDKDQPSLGLQSVRFDYQTLMADPILKALILQNNLELKDNKIQTKAGTVLLTLFQEDEAFEMKTPKASSGLLRDIYSKKGKAPGKNNEYVKDDKGVFTGRYAYIEKNKFQFRDLANEGLLTGRFPKDQTQPSGTRPYNEIDWYARQQVPSLPGGRMTFTNPYQLAYVHQELGSGAQQRGVSASSSPKYKIFSNQGEPFRSDDGVRIEVDLARVPTGTDTKPELINHYAYAARAKSEAAIGTYYIDKGSFQREFAHYQWSVKKNRELFIKEVKPGYITGLELHRTATGGTATESQPGGFTLTQVKTFGQNVGLAEYNLGFVDGRDGWRGTRVVAAKKKQYYDAGVADGKEYALGYGDGRATSGVAPKYLKKPTGQVSQQRVRIASNLADDSKVRYTQGLWDGRLSRAKRSY